MYIIFVETQDVLPECHNDGEQDLQFYSKSRMTTVHAYVQEIKKISIEIKRM